MATSTGTRRNLHALREHSWGLLLTPLNRQRHGFPLYGIDNGAWGAYCRQVEWNAVMRPRFEQLVQAEGRDAMWVVAPDIVCGGIASLERSLEWLPHLLNLTPRVLLAVQNGMEPNHLRQYLSRRVGLFVGGDTKWKLSTMARWGQLAAETGAWCHVGRVNSARRIHQCVLAGVHSFDGTSASRYATTVPLLDAAARRQRLPLVWEKL